MPTKLSQIYKPLLMGKKHSPPYTDHEPSWLCAKWDEYIDRYYDVTPKEGIEFINRMLEQEKTIGQESVQIRGCYTAGIAQRPLHPEEMATLKMKRKKLTRKHERDDEPPTKKLKVSEHIESIKRREQSIKKELQNKKEGDSIAPYSIKLPQKTEAEKLIEESEERKRKRRIFNEKIFKLAHLSKQFDVFSAKYKTFDTEEDLFEWLEYVLEQKEEGF